ncbi:hypothetical protein ECKD1_02113 [Escherichia coli KD1]|nr:hypothetical protein ECKD1_02113 [Escherichia coli KD1]
MFVPFLIMLREGLEAALIVSLISVPSEADGLV